jgi:molybdopterin-guanine dinucleotide biosynthesis protein A
VAHDGKRLQPVYALIPKRLSDSLQRYLDGGDRKIDLWYEKHRVAHADFSDIPRTFININTLQERDSLQGSAA